MNNIKVKEQKFHYHYYKTFLKKLLLAYKYPIQLELQPGINCGPYKCEFCYGYNQILNKEKRLTKEHYFQLLNDVKDKIPLILLAGIKSDPFNNSEIYDIINCIKINNFRLGIHTKGLFLTESLITLLNTNTKASKDFITFSIDANDFSTYNNLHGLSKDSNYFNLVIDNIKNLYLQKKSLKSNLNINVSYLLFRNNSSRLQLEEFIELFKNYSDTIRFSLPQIPNGTIKLPNYYLRKTNEINEIMLKLQEKYKRYNILFLNFKNNSHQTNFKYCYIQKFLAVIDSVGFVYPCPQITTKQFLPITYGNIKTKNFWDIWNSKRRQEILRTKVDKMKCRICDRKDETLNVELNKIFNNEQIY